MAPLRSLLLLALFGACAAPTPDPEAVRVTGDAALVRAVPEGNAIRIAASEGAPGFRTTGEVVDGWFREALRQSDWFDFAAGPVAGAASALPVLRLRLDSGAGLARAEFDDGTGPVLLGAVAVEPTDLPAALDQLAVRARIALGDPLPTGPIPIARLYSPVPDVVAACERALDSAQAGNFADTAALLQRVRRLDGGCTPLLDGMAAAAAMQGDARTALELAKEALALDKRLSPTTTHRLLRTLLLARASLEPQLASRYDEELDTLGKVAGRERPHDPETRLTQGIAANFLARFDEAKAVLQPLVARLPDHAGAAYHLGWAALGSGDPRTATRAFEAAARSLPARAIVVPRAIAAWSAGDQDGLRSLLAEVARDPAVRSGAAWHEIARMRAAHELLCGNAKAAVDRICEDLDWLLAHPATFDQRAGEFADVAETMVRLGEGARLRPYLLAALEHRANTPLADAATFGLGLVDATARDDRVPATEDQLRRRGAAFWADALTAYGSKRRGELAAENQALGTAATRSSSPLLKVALVQNLRAQGRPEEAATLLAAVRRELLELHLRKKLQHPLLGPELAYAYAAP